MAARTRTPVRWDDLPLFVFKDSDLAEAIVGPDAERRQVWLAGIPRLEACGFPKKTPGHGRYRPAVKAFYDNHYCVDTIRPTRPITDTPDGVWTSGRQPRQPLVRPRPTKP